MAKTVTIRITRHPNRYNGRLVATTTGYGGPESEWPFDWPADLNKYVQRIRAWAKRKGYTLDVRDETGQVR